VSFTKNHRATLFNDDLSNEPTVISAGSISLNSTFNRTFDAASFFYKEKQAKNQLCMCSIRPMGHGQASPEETNMKWI
jgi:hypothetical protein